MSTIKKAISKTKTSTKKATIIKSRVAKDYDQMKSFKLYSESVPFFHWRITKQTIYWLVLTLIILILQIWIIRIQLNIIDITDNVVAVLKFMLTKNLG